MYVMVEFLAVLLAIWVLAPTACFALLALFEGFPKVRLGQVAGIVAVSAWVFGLFSQQWPGPYLELSAIPMSAFFLGLWRHELRLLMLRGDDEFPGRFDKVGWFLLLTVAAPVGIWVFRSYRKARWPEAGSGPARSRPKSSPWDEPEEDGAEALAGAAAGRVE